MIFTVHSDVMNKQDIYEPFGYEHSVTTIPACILHFDFVFSRSSPDPTALSAPTGALPANNKLLDLQ